MFHLARQKRKRITRGCIVAVVCSIVLGLAGFLFASLQKDKNTLYVASETFNVIANSSETDPQVTKDALNVAVANDVTEFLKTDGLYLRALDAAGIGKDETRSYSYKVTHAAGTIITTLAVSGPDQDKAKKVLASAMSTVEEKGKDSFNLSAIEEVSSFSQEYVDTSNNAKPTLSPKKSAVLFAIAGFVIGILLVLIAYAINPRVRSDADAEEAAGLPVIGRISVRPAELINIVRDRS